MGNWLEGGGITQLKVFLTSPRLVILRRAAVAIFREIRGGGLEYRAMGLVYTSLLALVPLLAVGFSVLKTFGAESDLYPLLSEMLAPLGDEADGVAGRLLDSVKRLKVGVLGGVGFLFLFFTSVDLLEKIEESFNHIWRSRTSRTMLRRFGDYLTFTLIGPFLVFTAFGSVAGLFGHRPPRVWTQGIPGLMYQSLQNILPYVFVVIAFTFFYWVIPNTRVRFRAALVGGVLAGILWKLAGWMFELFIASSAQYHAIYSSFAILVLFMIWLYVSWLIVLLGVQVSFFYQHPGYLRFGPGPLRLSARVYERMGLAIMLQAGERFLRGDAPCGFEQLAEHLDLPEEGTLDILEVLASAGLLMPVGRERGIYAPARDLSAILLVDVLTVLRSAHEDASISASSRLAHPVLSGLTDNLDSALQSALAGRTLRDVLV